MFVSPHRYSFASLVFVLLWGLWLLIPSTREAALYQWKERFVTFPSTLGSDESSRDAEFVRALDASFKDRNSGALEALGQRYPNDAAICAMQIIRSANEMHSGWTRQPGPSSTPELNWSVKLAKIQKISPQVLQSWFAATKRGMKLEPNNTFWDWAQIMGLLAARRDNEVPAALRVARIKTAYDDHEGDSVLAQINSLREQRGIATPISQISLSAASLTPPFTVIREALRQISDNVAGARLSGDPQKQQQALQELADVMYLGRVMRRESKYSIGSITGLTIEAVAFWGGSYAVNGTLFQTRLRTGASVSAYAKDPHSLLAFARTMGREDIAEGVKQEWVEWGIWDRKYIKALKAAYTSDELSGLDTHELVLAQMGEWLGSLLLGGVPTLIVVALGCSILLRVVPLLRHQQDVPLPRFHWVWGAILSIIAVFVLSAASLWSVEETRQQTSWNLIDVLIAPLYIRRDNITLRLPMIWEFHFAASLTLVIALWCAA